MRFPIQLFIIIITSLSLSSCGYQLRGSGNTQELQNVKIISNDASPITRILQQKFGSLNNNDETMIISDPTIKIISITSKTRQLSVNSAGRADEYEIRKSLEYEFLFPDREKISDILHVTGSYDFDELQMHGTKEKEIITNRAIDRTLVRKLLLKFRAAAKSSKDQ